MQTINEFKMTNKDVIESPKDEILDGVITRIDKGMLREFLPENIDETKWTNLEQDTLLIHFETKYNDRNIGGTDRLSYYEKPMSNSKLGKFLSKYKQLAIGQEIKIEFDGEGFSSIKLK